MNRHKQVQVYSIYRFKSLEPYMYYNSGFASSLTSVKNLNILKHT
jgi:hypothetical protein